LTDRWKLFNDVQRIAPDALEARVCVPQDSIWFKGHFPGEPILPGIALVNTVYDAIAWDAQDRGESVQLSSLKRIKFMGPVRPGETFLLSMTREETSTERLYNFKVTVEDKIFCSGIMTVNKTQEKKG